MSEQISLKPASGKAMYIYYRFGVAGKEEMDNLDAVLDRAWRDIEDNKAAPYKVVVSEGGDSYYMLDREDIEELLKQRGYR